MFAVVFSGRSLLLSGFVLLAMAAPARANAPGVLSTSITVYSSAQPGSLTAQSLTQWEGNYFDLPGYGMVRQEREVELPQARTKLPFTDVPALIDPTTVSFASITDPSGTKVLEQNFLFDLASPQKLLQRYLGQTLTVDYLAGSASQSVTGTLVSAEQGLVLQTSDGKVVSINNPQKINYPALPGGLMVKPTLVWDVQTKNTGKQKIEARYETKGMTWWADYNVVFTPGKDANSGMVDVGGWVTLVNKSGGSFNDAKLRLIAGDVNRAPVNAPMPRGKMMHASGAMEMVASDAGFVEKSFAEYHMYTLGRPTDLPDNSTKQLELFPAIAKVPAEKTYLYYGAQNPYHYGDQALHDRNLGVQSNKKVDTYLTFKNAKENGLGIPFPAGRIRVSQLDTSDKSLEFIGEDTIDHTPKEEKILIKLGSAFDVVGERKQVDFKTDYDKKWVEETIEITIRNHKDEAIKLLVKENLYRAANWQITSKNSYDKIDSRTAHFPISIAKNGRETLRYTVRYTW